MARKVLIPVDHSEHSRRAIKWYLENLAGHNDDVILVSVVEPKMKLDLNTDHVNYEDLAVELKEKFAESQKKLVTAADQYREYLTQFGLKTENVHHQIIAGTKPGEVICNHVKNIGANLVIIGNRGLGTMKRAILGSVSEYIVHHVGIPIVLVPPVA